MSEFRRGAACALLLLEVVLCSWGEQLEADGQQAQRKLLPSGPGSSPPEPDGWPGAGATLRLAGSWLSGTLVPAGVYGNYCELSKQTLSSRSYLCPLQMGPQELGHWQVTGPSARRAASATWPQVGMEVA